MERKNSEINFATLFRPLYNSIDDAQAAFENTLRALNNQAKELIEKNYISKFFCRTYADGDQCIFNVKSVEVHLYFKQISLRGPQILFYTNGTSNYIYDEAVHINLDEFGDDGYQEKEISEQEYNDFFEEYKKTLLK